MLFSWDQNQGTYVHLSFLEHCTASLVCIVSQEKEIKGIKVGKQNDTTAYKGNLV